MKTTRFFSRNLINKSRECLTGTVIKQLTHSRLIQTIIAYVQYQRKKIRPIWEKEKEKNKRRVYVVAKIGIWVEINSYYRSN
jgi:hypothetical protein